MVDGLTCPQRDPKRNVGDLSENEAHRFYSPRILNEKEERMPILDAILSNCGLLSSPAFSAFRLVRCLAKFA
jgi:hypothetical protein